MTEMSRNDQSPKPLTARQQMAALLVALDQETDEAIARQVGLKVRQLTRWKRLPLFEARVAELRAAFARAVEGKGIAERSRRVQMLQDLVDRMALIVEGRAENMPLVPGGKSGLLVRQYKQTGKDDYQEEYHFDAALAREIRATLQQAAQELGQWTERHAVIDELDLSQLSDDELDALARGKAIAALKSKGRTRTPAS